jgi:hypothetical protein
MREMRRQHTCRTGRLSRGQVWAGVGSGLIAMGTCLRHPRRDPEGNILHTTLAPPILLYSASSQISQIPDLAVTLRQPLAVRLSTRGGGSQP